MLYLCIRIVTTLNCKKMKSIKKSKQTEVEVQYLHHKQNKMIAFYSLIKKSIT